MCQNVQGTDFSSKYLILTKCGMIGLAPWATKRNDLVVVLFGAMVLFMLRHIFDARMAVDEGFS